MSEELDNLIENSAEAAQPVISENPTSTVETSARKGLQGINPMFLAFNIIMLLGLIVLYVLFFTGRSRNSGSVSGAVEKASKGNISVAFVNNDSILSNYALVKKLRGELEEKGKRLEGEVAAKQKAFDKDAAYFQEQVQKKTISDQSAQEIYGQLQQNQQKIYALRDQYAAELQQSEAQMNVALLDSVMNFLQRYNQKYKFDYILGFTKGGNILLANDTLDLTTSVLKELNDEYVKKHGNK